MRVINSTDWFLKGYGSELVFIRIISGSVLSPNKFIQESVEHCFQHTSIFMNHVKVSSWSNIGSWMPKTAWGMFKDLGHFPTSTSADLQGASLIQPPSVEVWQPGKPLWQRWMCGQLYVTNRFNVRQKEKGGFGFFVGQMQVSVFPGLQTTSRWKIYILGLSYLFCMNPIWETRVTGWGGDRKYIYP